MRYHEIAAGFPVPVHGEEQELLDKAAPYLVKDDLSEREQEVARLMVSRGLLRQFMKNGKLHYRQDSDKDIWRDRDG
jgi:hypothetical protein